MSRKSVRRTFRLPSSDRRQTLAAGALVASALATLSSGQAAASELVDARLRVIHDALTPQRLGLNAPSASFVDDEPGQSTRYDLRIEAGALSSVVSAIEAATGLKITLANESLATLPSPGVRGSFTADEALREALAGTGVSFRMTAGNEALLDIAALSESISVSGAVATVASPKYRVPLREIPQTIEVIPRAAMESQAVTTLSEALRNVPGITLQAGEGGGASSTAGDMFTMRGFNASNSLFVDNVRDDGLVSRDVYNLEQIEVFSGPTGSDVGRGTAAGYINMQTKTPHLPPARSGMFTLGTASQRRGTFDINQPLTSRQNTWLSKSAVRLNAMWQDSGVPGRDEAQNESRAISPSIALGLSTPTRVIASAQILRSDNTPDYGVSAAAWADEPLAPTTVRALNPVRQTNYYGSPDYDYDRSRQNTYTARIEHDLSPGWTITNQTRRNHTEREAVVTSIGAFTAATQTVALQRQGNARENEITSNQTALLGRAVTGSLVHSITSGMEFSREAQFTPTFAGVGTRGPVDIYNPNPFEPVVGYAPARTLQYTDGSTRTAAVYAFDTVTVNPRLKVTGGLRFENYSTRSLSVGADGLPVPPAAPAAGQESVACDDDANRICGDGNLLSGKLGAVVQLNRTTNVYASYGTTLTPPGASNFALNAAANNQNAPNVDPQKAANTEVGIKSDLADGRLSLSGAVFHTVNRNVLFTIPNTVPPEFNQNDKQVVNGVTLGASGQITREWNVLASFSYLDTEAVSQNLTNNGQRIQLAPAFSGNIWTTYQLPKNFNVGGGIRSIGDVYVNAANTIIGPGYTLVDALAEYAVSPKLTLRLNINNLLDTVYIRNVNNNGGRYNPGLARTAQLTAAVKF